MAFGLYNKKKSSWCRRLVYQWSIDCDHRQPNEKRHTNPLHTQKKQALWRCKTPFHLFEREKKRDRKIGKYVFINDWHNLFKQYSSRLREKKTIIVDLLLYFDIVWSRVGEPRMWCSVCSDFHRMFSLSKLKCRNVQTICRKFLKVRRVEKSHIR